MRSEAGHFDVVTKQIRVFGNFVHRAAEELLLIIEARSPCQIGPNFQILTHTMPDHILRMHALRRFDVMQTTSGVDVMITGPPAKNRGIDPASHLERARLPLG